ncbi:hypothetical protein DFJ74DRAFT_697949 [Hyaloraphidium curvatum]|nr:hypothetical protein DFJ74DRAFT_697949 [Hyaloraphidium curvatum]
MERQPHSACLRRRAPVSAAGAFTGMDSARGPRRPAASQPLATAWKAILFLAVLIGNFLAASAQKLPPPFYFPDPNTVANQITAAGITAGVITIVAGVLMCLFGIRLFRICLFFAGAYLFGIIAYTLLYVFEPANGVGYPVNRYWLYVGVTAGAGLVGGLLLGLLWQLGLIVLGAVGGLFLGLFISGLLSNVLPSWGGIVIIVVLAIVGAIAIWFLQTPLIIISTSIAGSVSTFWGIDFFVQVGFNQMLTVLFKGQFQEFDGWNWTPALIGMVVGCGVFAGVGMLLQFCVFSHHPWKPAKGGGCCC